MTVELPGRNRRCAFSLLELIIIMIIAGIISSIAVPRYAAAIAHRRADSAAWRIALDLSAAQRQARIVGAARTVSFDLDTHEYTIAGDESQTVQLALDPYQASIVSVDFGGDEEIGFDGYGGPDSGGSIIVQSGNIQKMVLVDGQSGMARVQ